MHLRSKAVPQENNLKFCVERAGPPELLTHLRSQVYRLSEQKSSSQRQQNKITPKLNIRQEASTRT